MDSDFVKKTTPVGVLGGTFNPVHNGHLFLAMEARYLYQLEKVVLIPNRIPPHKAAPTVDQQARLEMLERAIEGIEGLEISTVELDRNGPSYTFHTLQALPEDWETTFISGADAFSSPWFNLNGVLSSLHRLLIARRPGSPHLLPTQIKDLGALPGNKVELMEFPEIAISSSDIRARIEQDRPFRFLIPDSVYRMIADKKLYR